MNSIVICNHVNKRRKKPIKNREKEKKGNFPLQIEIGSDKTFLLCVCHIKYCYCYCDCIILFFFSKRQKNLTFERK